MLNAVELRTVYCGSKVFDIAYIATDYLCDVMNKGQGGRHNNNPSIAFTRHSSNALR